MINRSVDPQDKEKRLRGYRAHVEHRQEDPLPPQVHSLRLQEVPLPLGRLSSQTEVESGKHSGPNVK